MLWSIVVASSLAASPAASPALVVWMQAAPPDAATQALAERETGRADHRAWSDITLAPEPITAADEGRQSTLAQVLKDGKGRWEEFEAEAGVARALASAIEPVAVVSSVAERDALITALYWEGAGITRGYPEHLFTSLQDTSPFRVSIAGKSMVRPWVDAVALDPKRTLERSSFPDGQSYAKVVALAAELALLPRGKLMIDPLPAGAIVVLDGVPLAEGAREAELAPGHHYAHVLVGGAVAERMEFDVAPSDVVALKTLVSPDELSTAASLVSAGSNEVPADVAAGVRSLAGRGTAAPRVFLATVDEKGKPKLVAFSGGAVVVQKRPVTFMFVGELGGGVLQSSGFSGMAGAESLTYHFGGHLGFELGIYNFVLYGGSDLALSPAVQMAFGTPSGTEPEDNGQTSAFARPHGGVGVYLPRPIPGKVWFMLGANYGWMAPSSMGPGVRLSVGVPLANDAQTWFRITLDGYRGTQMDGFVAEGTPTSLVSLRVGFGSLL